MQVISMADGVPTGAQEESHVDTAAVLVAAWVQPGFRAKPVAPVAQSQCHALEAPIWERFGSFAGQPMVRGEVVWMADDRSVLIRGRRSDRPFEELSE
jgi:hypothetical protein